MFAKAEFTNLNPDFICGIRSGSGLAKAESIFHKIIDRSKKNVSGDNLWSRSTKFENIVEFVAFILWNSTIFLGPTYFLWNLICEFRFRKHSNSQIRFHKKYVGPRNIVTK